MLPNDSLEYLYGVYKKRAKLISRDAVMPRSVFNIMMTDVGCIDQGIDTIERFFESIFESMLSRSLDELKEETE